jgi:eukaryotic-like serine/threonine-protein kinase
MEQQKNDDRTEEIASSGHAEAVRMFPTGPSGPLPPELGETVESAEVVAVVVGRGTAGPDPSLAVNTPTVDQPSGVAPGPEVRLTLGESLPEAPVGVVSGPSPAPRPAVSGYEILGELGRGGMGVVYKARQVKLNRLVALKMVLAGAHAGARHLARFGAEARAVARLQHPNIVSVYEIGESEGLPFFSLEFVDGPSLAQKVGGKPLPPRQAADILEPLARAMAEAHENGVIHRDLKPANVLLTADGVPKVTDFGLAKEVEGDSDLTKSGTLVGTPSYMSPEQARGATREIGPRSDLYGLGAILYELLTGRPPFLGTSLLATLYQVRQQEPVPPHRLQPGVPRDLETICLKCLQKEPDKRYADCAALAEDLRRFRTGEPIRAHPVGHAERLWRWCRRNPRTAALSAAVAGLLGLVVLGLGVLLLRARREKEAIAQTRTVAGQRLEQAAEAVSGGEYHRAADLLRWSDPLLEGSPDLQDVRARRDTLRDQVGAYAQFRQLLDDARFACRFGSRAEKENGRRLCARLLALYDEIDRRTGRGAAGLPPLNAERLQLFKEDAFEAFLVAALVEQDLTAGAGPTARREAARRGVDLLNRAEKVLPGTRALHVYRAPLWGKLGDRAADRADMDRARAIPPVSAVDSFWHAFASHLRGEEALRQGDSEGARRHYRQAVAEYAGFLRLRPDHFWGYFNWAFCLVQLGDLHNALVGFTACAHLRPDFPWPYNNRGTVYLRLGQPAEAVRDYDSALARDPNYVEAFVNRSAAYLTLGKTDRAYADIQKALALNPDHAPAYLQRAEVHRSRRRLDAALKDCDRAVELDGTSTRAYEARAILRYARGDYAGARDDFSRLVALAPKSPDGYRNRAVVSWRHLKDFDSALADFARVARLQPRNPDPHRCLGAIHLGRREYEKALVELQKALAIQPGYPPAVWARAEIYLWQGKTKEALAEIDPLLTAAPPVPAETLNIRGDVYRAMGRLDEAAADYRRLIRLKPQDADAFVHAHVSLALVYEKQGKPGEAKACLDRLVAADPGSARAYLRRAECLRNHKEFDSAPADCDRAARLDPKSPLPDLVRAGVLAARGEHRAGVELAERALERAPKDDGQVLYAASCAWSLASGAVAADPGAPGGRELARRYADRAAGLLAQTLDRGFHDLIYPEHNRMAEDPALGPIRHLPRVRELIAHRP